MNQSIGLIGATDQTMNQMPLMTMSVYTRPDQVAPLNQSLNAQYAAQLGAAARVGHAPMNQMG